MSNKIFFSYSFTDDKDLKITKIKKLIETFTDDDGNQLYDVFMASDPVNGNTSGRSWNSQEKQVMLNSFLIVLFLSDNSISSKGVAEELDFYFNKMRKNKRKNKFLYISLNGKNYCDTIFDIMQSDEYLNDIELETVISKFESHMDEPDFSDHHLYIKYTDKDLKKRLESTLYELYLGFNQLRKPKKTDVIETKQVKTTAKVKQVKEIKEDIHSTAIMTVNNKEEFVPIYNKIIYHSLPYEGLLNGNVKNRTPEEILEEDLSLKINDILEQLGINGNVINFNVGCQFSSYEINVPINKIRIIFLDLVIRLRVNYIVLSHTSKTTTLMIPNKKKIIFYLKEAIDNNFINSNKRLLAPIGKNVKNEIQYYDITEFPHILIGGIAGSGKTNFIQSILISLLTKYDSTKLKLCIYDTKMAEYLHFNGIPHMLSNVLTKYSQFSSFLKWLRKEIQKRYDKFKSIYGVSITDYNDKILLNGNENDICEYILCVVDDYSYFVDFKTKEDEENLQFILSFGRAAGVHMIISSLRVDTHVLTGQLKANFNTRIAFKVINSIDSRCIIDEEGAEGLLGCGDMIINNGIISQRLQAPYVDMPSIIAVCEHISKTTDELLESVAEFCVKNKKCSTTSIQMEFSIGFNRARKLVAELEEMNIVSPRDSNGTRTILVDQSQLKEIFKNR